MTRRTASISQSLSRRSSPPTTCDDLFKRRIPLEHGQFAERFHPADAIGGLDLRLRRNQIGIVERRGLHINLTGKNRVVGIKKARAAIVAEMTPTMFGRCVDLCRAADLDVLL